MGVHDRDRAQVVGVHKSPVRAEAQGVRGREAGEDDVVAGGYSDVLACRIRVKLHKRAV